jgi:hypothetical protein
VGGVEGVGWAGGGEPVHGEEATEAEPAAPEEEAAAGWSSRLRRRRKEAAAAVARLGFWWIG